MPEIITLDQLQIELRRRNAEITSITRVTHGVWTATIRPIGLLATCEGRGHSIKESIDSAIKDFDRKYKPE